MRRAVPVLAALISALLSSGLTTVWLRTRDADTVAVRPPFQVAPEYRAIAALLVAPGPPYVPVDAGTPVQVVAGLTALGFTRGWQQSWRAATREHVDGVVLEFRDDTGATGYASGIGRAASLLAKPRPFTVAGVPGSSGLADTVRDKDGFYAYVVVMHRGARAALLFFTAASPDPAYVVAALAQREYAALGT